MRPWCAGPPVLAAEVRHLLPCDLLSNVPDIYTTLVAPQYTRLAMGSSHSVYMLMQINLRSVGCTLFNYSRLLHCRQETLQSTNTECAVKEPLKTLDFEIDDSHSHELEHRTDEEWLSEQKRNKTTTSGESGFTVTDWCRAVREAKQRSSRIITCMLFFAGPRRNDDIEHWLQRVADWHTYHLH